MQMLKFFADQHLVTSNQKEQDVNLTIDEGLFQNSDDQINVYAKTKMAAAIVM